MVFDLGPTLRWYEQEEFPIVSALAANVWLLSQKPGETPNNYTTHNNQRPLLRDYQLEMILNLFPKAFQQRSVLRNIVEQPVTYFRAGMTVNDIYEGNPNLLTTKRRKAFSPDAYCPGYTATRNGDETIWPNVDIHVYRMDPQQWLFPKRIATLEAFIHEYVHSVTYPAWYLKETHVLRMGSKTITGFDALMEFVELTSTLPSISVYAGGYRNADGTYPTNPQQQAFAIHEELAETITARILRFCFCDSVPGREGLGLTPFADRPAVKDWVDTFLHAELVPAPSDTN